MISAGQTRNQEGDGRRSPPGLTSSRTKKLGHESRFQTGLGRSSSTHHIVATLTSCHCSKQRANGRSSSQTCLFSSVRSTGTSEHCFPLWIMAACAVLDEISVCSWTSCGSSISTSMRGTSLLIQAWSAREAAEPCEGSPPTSFDLNLNASTVPPAGSRFGFIHGVHLDPWWTPWSPH